MRIKKILKFLVVVLLLCIIPIGKVHAEELKLVHEENFAADHSLKGLFAACEEYFQVGNWDVEEANLTLFYTVTTLVREEESDFTVILNGEPIFSKRLTMTAGETQKLTISLPEYLIKEGTNSIRVESYVRTNEDDPCKEDISSASWMVLRKDTFVSLSYTPKKVCANIADVYQQITSIEGLENEQSAIFLPEAPTENELTLSAYLLTGMAQNAMFSYDSLKLIQTDNVEEMGKYSYGAYVGEYERIPDEIRTLLSEEQKEAAKEGAVISFQKMPSGLDLLIITGSDEVALQNACRLFGNKLNMDQSKATWRKVTADEDANVIKPETNVKKLTEIGSYVYGPFKQGTAFTVQMEANKSIATGSEAEIHMRYAQNLDFDRSLVTVYIDDVPIGSKKLEAVNANGDSLKISIPTNLNLTGNFTMSVVFDLEMKDLICDIRRQDMPWAYVTNESTVDIITQDVPWLLFDYYPGPFVYNGKLNEVIVVLPVQESEEDVEAMRKILLTLGRYETDNSGNISVRRADNMGDLSESNVISIGCLEDNPIVQQINNQLYFQFSPQGTTIRSNEKMKIEPNYGAVLGTAQVLYSPYSTKKYALMIVSGVTKEGMLDAAEYLGFVEKNWQIYGDGFVTDGETVSCYRFGDDNRKGAGILGSIVQQEGVLMLLITTAGVLILLCISLFLIWNKHRKES